MNPFRRLWVLSCTALAFAACQSGTFRPETSSLFDTFTDPESGVVSYVLRYGAPDDNRQSVYFTAKSLTDDGRYLVFWYTQGNERKGCGEKRQMLADLKKGKVYDIGPRAMIPFIEAKEDYIVYGNTEEGFFRRDFARPEEEVKLCGIPSELTSLGKVMSLATHLTLTRDRKKAFLDTHVETPEGKDRYIQGLLNLETGAWETWGETEWICNHGQLNPADDSLALCAWEEAWGEMGSAYMAETGWYPRMWLVRKGSKELVPCKTVNFASHEIWDADGKGFSWCCNGDVNDSSQCVYHHDLATGEETVWAALPGARHNSCSPDGKYVVTDQAPETWWRGCRWRVAFWNRETGKHVWIYSTRDALMPQDNQSKLHPDPHPHFEMDGKYVVCTANNGDGHMDLFLTPVDQLIKMTE